MISMEKFKYATKILIGFKFAFQFREDFFYRFINLHLSVSEIVLISSSQSLPKKLFFFVYLLSTNFISISILLAIPFAS